MKFHHMVRFRPFQKIMLLKVDYHAYRIPLAYFSHFSFITEMDYSLVLILPRFALLKLSSECCMILTSHKFSMVIVKVLNTIICKSFSSLNGKN